MAKKTKKNANKSGISHHWMLVQFSWGGFYECSVCDKTTTSEVEFYAKDCSRTKRRSVMADENMKALVVTLWYRLKREPTVDEVMQFISGDETMRLAIWNKER